MKVSGKVTFGELFWEHSGWQWGMNNGSGACRGFCLVRFVTSSAVWCTQSTELPQDTLQLDTCRLICLEVSGKKKKECLAGQLEREILKCRLGMFLLDKLLGLGFFFFFLVLLALCRMPLVYDHLTELLKTSLNVGNLVSILTLWISDNSWDEMHIVFGDEINNLYNCIGIKLPSCA